MKTHSASQHNVLSNESWIAQLPGAEKKPMPTSFSPELATLAKTFPTKDKWLYEIKFDGYRILGFIHAGKAKLISRNGKDWSAKFPHVCQALAQLPIKSGVVDGEVVALNNKGVSQFQLLQNALEFGDHASICYYVFDLPYAEGFDLQQVPLKQRKECLKKILIHTPQVLRYSDDLQGDAKTLLAHACKLKLEGLMAKLEQSVYQNKRSTDWLKLKCSRQQELVIGGFTSPGGARQYFGALLMGYYDEMGHFKYAGKVGTGFNEKILKELYEKMKKLVQESSSFYQIPTTAEFRAVHWIKPKLVAEVEFTEWTNEDRMRHPSFKGLRLDKTAHEVRQEK